MTTTMGIYNGHQQHQQQTDGLLSVPISLLSNSSLGSSVAPLDGFILSFALMSAPTTTTPDISNMMETTNGNGKTVVSPLLSLTNQLRTDQRTPSGDHHANNKPIGGNKSDTIGTMSPIAINKLTPGAPNQWQSIQLPAQQRSYHLKSLDCGTSYALWILAFNKVGKGEPSDMLTLTTRGKGMYLR